MTKHESKNYMCSQCSRTFDRSDNLNRHKKTCQPDISHQCCKCQKNFSRKDSLKRHIKMCKQDSISPEDAVKLERETAVYKQTIERGRQLSNYLLKNKHILEEALPLDEKEALQLYQQSCTDYLDMEKITLKRWQKQVLNFLDRPSERSVYWIHTPVDKWEMFSWMCQHGTRLADARNKASDRGLTPADIGRECFKCGH